MGALVDKSLGKPVQGVSQQDESIRPDGQCNEQINFLPDPVYGLRRRPPTEKLLTLPENDMYLDFMDKEGTRLLCINSSTQEVSNYSVSTNTLDTVTVDNQDALDYVVTGIGTGKDAQVAYMESTDPTATEDGILYIANPNVTVQEDTTYVAPTRFDNVGIVYCLGGQYSREFSITVTYTDGTTNTGTFETPAGTTASHYTQIASTYIIEQLYDSLLADAGSNLDLEVFSDHMMLVSNNKTITDISVSDDEGGTLLKLLYKTVDSLDELATYAPENMIVTVAGDTTTDTDDSYFLYLIKDSLEEGLASFGETGVWVETVKAGDEFQFDKTTMPVGVYYNSGTYNLDLVDWKGRELGDADSNETPSILNNTIQDITTLQSRLALLSDYSVLFSRTRRPSELWRQSIIGGIQVSDAIDGQGDASTGTHTFFTKVQQDLSVFSSNGQYTIYGNTAITPDNMNLSLTTHNDTVRTVKPIGVSGNVYSLKDNGDFVGMFAYFKQDNSYYAIPVSAHVPRYIEGKPIKLKGSDAQRTLAIQTDADSKTLYCYKFSYNANKLTQSAWFKLEFNNDIIHYFFSANRMFVITQGDSEHILEEIKFDTVADAVVGFDILLDRRITYTLDADAAFTPDDIHTDAIFVSKTTESAGLVIDYIELGDGRYQVTDGNEGEEVVGGFTFKSQYTPTRPRIRDANEEVINTGVLNVRDLYVNVRESGSFSWKVDTSYGTSIEGEISNRVWNDANNKVGSEPMYTKQWRIPWRGKSIDKQVTISCENYTPLNIPYIEFVGDFRKTRKRV